MPAIDNYQIVETLADQQKKSVFRCKDVISLQTYIVKELKAEVNGREEVARFKQEYRLLEELRGKIPGVIQPVSLKEQNGLIYMVLGDIQGKSVKQILASEKPDLPVLLKLTMQIIDIIGAIHEQGIIHKDIKPDNLIWNRKTDEVQLIDFDLAVKLPKEKREFQNSGTLEGSLFYISPEQTGRMNRSVDYRTDYYSLGVMLYELSTGSRPFQETDMLEQMYAIMAKQAVPPHELTGGKVSRSLSAVIMKLLEKAPEDRYRSAYGIKADLRKCLAGDEDLVPGAMDRVNVFQIPQRIYGRAAASKRLADAFRNSIGQAARLVLVEGEAGVGKTTLVHELHPLVSQESGMFATGKFDQYNRNIPYSAVIRAFRRMVAQMLLNRDARFHEQVEAALRVALNGDGALITGFIPELERWIGIQPELERLSPTEETHRFFLTFNRFIEGLMAGGRPLVLFLDDIQWADRDSLKLVEQLLLRSSNLFIVCTLRKSETQQAAFLSALADLDKTRKVERITVPPLTENDVAELLSDTLGLDHLRVKPLADVLYKRTKGNAFFLNEILKELHRSGYLYFDMEAGNWSWRLEPIIRLPMSNDVITFLMDKLAGLSETTRGLLMLGAAIGNSFDSRMLALIADTDTDTVTQALIVGVEKELLIPLDGDYADWMRTAVAWGNEPIAMNRMMRMEFQHDRIQQALYQMIEPGKGPKLHLTIGRLLLSQLPPDEAQERLVDIAMHMNRGLTAIGDAAERKQVIALSLAAARKAADSFGYDTAFVLLGAIIPLLEADTWRTNREQTAEIYQLYASSGYMTHRLTEANQAAEELLSHTEDRYGSAQIYELQARHYTYLGLMKESIQAGRLGLAALGMRIPEKVGMAQVLQAFIAAKTRLRGRSMEELFALPEMTEPQTLLRMRLLINFIPPAFISGETALFGFIVLKKIGLTLQYGNSPESALAYIGYSMLLSGFGDTQAAFDYGRLGIRINAKFNDLQWKGATHVLYTLFCHTWSEPWGTLAEWYKGAMDASTRAGDLLYLAHSCFYLNLWNPSLDLASALEENTRTLAIIESTQYKEAYATAKLSRQLLLGLMGELSDPLSFDSEDFSEAAYLQLLTEADYYSGIAIYYIYKIRLLITYDSYQEAYSYLDRAYAVVGTLAGSAFMEEFALYTFLTLTHCYKGLSIQEKAKARRRMRKELHRVRKWAQHNPDNFRQHELLMRAEWARITGKTEQAGNWYDAAIAESERGNVVRYKALTHELAALYYSERGFKEFSKYLLRQALFYYSVWGAEGKLRHLRERYPEAFSKRGGNDYPHDKSVSDVSESLDLNSMLLASQAISKEIELNHLLSALMEIVIKNAGAERGTIVMKASPFLLVTGEYLPDSDRIEVHIHEGPPDRHLPLAVLAAVEESRESMIYNDAFSETPYVNDAYIVEHRPKSLVCMPLVNQHKVTAVIYLENNLIAGAFTEERMRIIHLLSREMVFSLENASLYSTLERSEEKYRELVHHMQDGIFITQDRACQYVNAALAAMLGYEIEEMLGQPFQTFLHPDDREGIVDYYERRINGLKAPQEYETRLIHKDGQVVTAIHQVSLVTYGMRPAIQGTIKDITERKRSEDELRRHKEHLEELVAERTRELEDGNAELNRYIRLIERISITDELTGLYNRRYFNQVFRAEVEQAQQTQAPLSCIMLDIDYYKRYNDTYGHYEGDNVLRRLGEVLSALPAGFSGHVFRLGGEEFGILLPGCGPEEAFVCAEFMRSAVRSLQIPHSASPDYGVITVSVGVASVHVEGMGEVDIYKLADEALYQSKVNGRDRVTLLVH
jgi:diguanylate cyclase (GGDEF)-like protein/PAS domain S-box-containing protein